MATKKLVDLEDEAHDTLRDFSHASRIPMKRIASALILKNLKYLKPREAGKPNVRFVQSLVKQ